MQTWKLAVLSSAAGVCAAMLFLAVMCCARRSQGEEPAVEEKQQRRKHKSGKVRLEQEQSGVRAMSNWRATYPVTAFSWGNHTAYVAEAVEHGWPAFALAYYASPSMPVASSLWHMCTKCALHDGFEPEVTWDMGSGVDYMQQVRFNPGMASKRDSCVHPVQALQAALPLPGPCLVPCSFPQEAYYEVTVLAEGAEYKPGTSCNNSSVGTDNEYVKLLRRAASDLSHNGFAGFGPPGSGKGSFDLSTFKRADADGAHNNEAAADLHRSAPQPAGHVHDLEKGCVSDFSLHCVAVGLGAANAPPFRLPGTDLGSVGYHSMDGSVYLNGTLYVDDAKKLQTKRRTWGAVTDTVGCGFDPRIRKVYFTLNGETVHEVSCKSSEFGSPLFPIVAANYDVTVMVNYGQVPFEYLPANNLRAAEPSCRAPHSRSGKMGGLCEDSGDLFSMGRIDSHWLSELESPNSPDLQHRHVLSETESELFEIALDSRG